MAHLMRSHENYMTYCIFFCIPVLQRHKVTVWLVAVVGGILVLCSTGLPLPSSHTHPQRSHHVHQMQLQNTGYGCENGRVLRWCPDTGISWDWCSLAWDSHNWEQLKSMLLPLLANRSGLNIILYEWFTRHRFLV